jgi:predicted ferric reductase
MSVLVTYALWLGCLWHADAWYPSAWLYPAKIGSHGTLILMCWAFILATRFRMIEWFFGGLDKVYVAHRRVGEIAFFLIFLHPLFLAIASSRSVRDFLAYLWFSENWVRNTGLIALLSFMLLVVLSIYIKIAYHRWKRIHDWFGLLLVLVVVHAVSSQGEIMKFMPLTLWHGFWVTLGLGAYVYIRFLYRFIGPQFDVVVAEVRDAGDQVTEIFLDPVGRAMALKPGQFIYISFDADAVTEEPHPFSLSSAPEQSRLRLSIKRLGDWTRDVEGIKTGERARIWGPYGHFSEGLFREDSRPAVMIGGGIGITPILSTIHSQAFARRQAVCHVVYAVPHANKLIYETEIKQRAAALKFLTYHRHLSDEQGFMDGAFLESIVTSPLSEHQFLVCGPPAMMQALANVFSEAGIKTSRIAMEEFAIR